MAIRLHRSIQIYCQIAPFFLQFNLNLISITKIILSTRQTPRTCPNKKEIISAIDFLRLPMRYIADMIDSIGNFSDENCASHVCLVVSQTHFSSDLIRSTVREKSENFADVDRVEAIR